MTNVVIWKKQLSVGNSVIDAGHQNLIGMINSLEYAIKQKDGSQLLRVLKSFFDSARLHFKDEEKIMQAVEFPLVQHQQEHQNLLDDLEDTLGYLTVQNGTWPEYVMDHYPGFLRDWFADHVNNGIATLKPVLQAYPYDFIPV